MTGRLWWEDLTVGRSFQLGSYAVTREEVIEFATRFDPQPFHMDDEAARANPIFGRLSASGPHTFAMTSRMTCDGYRHHGIVPMAGAGTDELRFHHPVYPGDVLAATTEVALTRPLKSRADRGLVHLKTATRNQDGVVVMSYTGLIFIERRPAA